MAMLSVKDFADRLGLSRSKVYHLVKQKRIGHYRVEGKIAFDERDMEEFLEECRVEKSRARKAPPCRRLKHLKLS